MSTKARHRKKEEEISERTAPPGTVVYAAIKDEGENELQRSTSALAWSGLAAGLSMGFSMAAQGLLQSRLPEAMWSPLISNLGYTVGFLIVVLGRQQLFTENTLTPILSLLKGNFRSRLPNVLRLWAVVLVTNLAGTMAFAVVAARLDVFDPQTKKALSEIGHEMMNHGFGNMMLKAVFAGWLIALMVWLLPAADSARIWVIIIISYLVGIAGFPHIIAGTTETFYLVADGQMSFSQFAMSFAVPTLMGNILGGVTLVAVLAHAQFMLEEREEG